MLRVSSVAPLLIVISALSACTGSTSAPSASVTQPKPPVDPTPIIGSWCSNSGQRFTVTREQFKQPRVDCDITKLNNYEGTYTLGLVCTRDGVQSSDNITITPVDNAVLISFLTKGIRTIKAHRCGGAAPWSEAPPTPSSPSQ